MRVALEETPSSYPIDRHIEALAAIADRDPAALRRAIEADIQSGIGHLGNTGLLVRTSGHPVGCSALGDHRAGLQKSHRKRSWNAREAGLT